MSDLMTTARVMAYVAILLLGGSVTYFSVRAYRRRGSRALAALSVGLGLITAGLASHGVLDGSGVEPTWLSLVPALLSVLGLGLVLYSLFTRRDT